MGVASGKVEPIWIAAAGALVYEYVDSAAPSPPSFPPVNPPPPVDPGDRYGNPGGSRPPIQTPVFETER